ncbi:uncharacterized protein ELE39_002658 [Cryptosporidium sp. chipmunk genotype I]|uniref:uncharacterized protein n=1 Tax=Cryptosporidium sp. chipmunk genotype I TaxID=1280935 RepID=UPI00351A9DDD|nr:hypothetical protein ELE39_002658 [Cryptosporidium sp. chipmunk genotype I]
MRRLQSFKTPSRLNEKLKFSSKNSSNDVTINNGIKFVPNVTAFNSSEAVDNCAQTDNISLTNIKFGEKFDLEKVKQPKNTHNFDLPSIKVLHRSEAINESRKQAFIYDSSNRISAKPAIGNRITSVCNDITESRLEKVPKKLEGWSVFQLPKYMPENKKNIFEINKDLIPTLLHDTPSGSIGKLIFRRGGNIDLSLNSNKDKECISFKIDCISRDNSEQFITAFSKINELINLGKCDTLLIATPKI